MWLKVGFLNRNEVLLAARATSIFHHTLNCRPLAGLITDSFLRAFSLAASLAAAPGLSDFRTFLQLSNPQPSSVKSSGERYS